MSSCICKEQHIQPWTEWLLSYKPSMFRHRSTMDQESLEIGSVAVRPIWWTDLDLEPGANK